MATKHRRMEIAENWTDAADLAQPLSFRLGVKPPLPGEFPTNRLKVHAEKGPTADNLWRFFLRVVQKNFSLTLPWGKFPSRALATPC